MRRAVALIGTAAALAACSGDAGKAHALPAGEGAPAPPAVAPRPAPVPLPGGDRHARAAARRSPVVKRATGRLARSDDRSLVVGSPDAPALTLRIAPGTTVTLDGRPARAETLPPGAEIRAAYRTGEGGRPTAIAIEARRPPDARGSAEGGRGPQGAGEPPGEEPAADAPPPASWQGSPDVAPIDGG